MKYNLFFTYFKHYSIYNILLYIIIIVICNLTLNLSINNVNCEPTYEEWVESVTKKPGLDNWTYQTWRDMQVGSYNGNPQYNWEFMEYLRMKKLSYNLVDYSSQEQKASAKFMASSWNILLEKYRLTGMWRVRNISGLDYTQLTDYHAKFPHLVQPSEEIIPLQIRQEVYRLVIMHFKEFENGVITDQIARQIIDDIKIKHINSPLIPGDYLERRRKMIFCHIATCVYIYKKQQSGEFIQDFDLNSVSYDRLFLALRDST